MKKRRNPHRCAGLAVLLTGLALLGAGVPAEQDPAAKAETSKSLIVEPPMVPQGAPAPVGLTWHVGFNWNATPEEMMSYDSDFAETSEWLWDLSGGRVYLEKIRCFGEAIGGTGPWGPSLDQKRPLDVWFVRDEDWGAVEKAHGRKSTCAFVTNCGGRIGRIIVLPRTLGYSQGSSNSWIKNWVTGEPVETIVHEATHFVFYRERSGETLLHDEYNRSVFDDACVLNETFGPVWGFARRHDWFPDLEVFRNYRWCTEETHAVTQERPYSCWKQLEKWYGWTPRKAEGRRPPLRFEYEVPGRR